MRSKLSEQEALIHKLNETIASYDIQEKQSLQYESTQQFNDSWSNIDEILSDDDDDDEETSTYVDREGRVRKKRKKNWD